MITQQHFSPHCCFIFSWSTFPVWWKRGKHAFVDLSAFRLLWGHGNYNNHIPLAFLPLFVCPELSSPVNFDITESIIAPEWEQVKTSQRFPTIFKLPSPQASAHGLTLNFCVFSGVLTNLSWQVQFVFPYRQFFSRGWGPGTAYSTMSVVSLLK